MSIEFSCTVVVPRPRSEVFAEATDITIFHRYFTGYPPLIPRVTSGSMDDGAVPGVGATRTVKLGDGSVIRERITAWTPGVLHGYEMAEMNALQRLLVTNMIAEWRFEDDPSGTRVTWGYAFFAKGPVRRPVVWVMSRLFGAAMQRCLENLAKG